MKDETYRYRLTVNYYICINILINGLHLYSKKKKERAKVRKRIAVYVPLKITFNTFI